MDLGLALPQHEHSVPGERPLRWASVVAWARAAEAARFSSVWLSDAGGQALEPVTAMAGVARATSAVRLGVLGVAAPLRPPAVLAKAVATLDVLAGGRVTLALEAGELDLLGEAMEVLRRSFTGEPFSFAGRHVRIEGMRCRPRPVQRPGPPLWVRGDGDEVLRLVARGADGWCAPGWSGPVGAYEERRTALDRACEAAGRDPAGVERCVTRLALVGEDERDLRRRWERALDVAPRPVPVATLEDLRRGGLAGTVEQVGEQLEAWAAAGVTTLVLALGALPFAVTAVDDLDLVASVAPPN